MALMVRCQRCGQEYIQPDIVHGPSIHSCWDRPDVLPPLTKKDVREIVREELERFREKGG